MVLFVEKAHFPTFLICPDLAHHSSMMSFPTSKLTASLMSVLHLGRSASLLSELLSCVQTANPNITLHCLVQTIVVQTLCWAMGLQNGGRPYL